MKDMQTIHLCIECAWENPRQLDMEMRVARDNQLIAEEIAQTQTAVKDVNAGIQWFQLKPEGDVGQGLLEHMFMKHQLCYKTKVKDIYAQNAYMDVAMQPGSLEILWFKDIVLAMTPL
jgi:hypothetical protein